MGLFDFFNKKTESNADEVEALKAEVNDLRLAIKKGSEKQRSLAQEIKTRRRTLARPLAYATYNTDSGSKGRKSYYGPNYDLAEIARAMDVEPYIAISVRKHREQILKEGYQIVGQDDEMVSYIQRRLHEISVMSGTTTDQWLREFTTQLVSFGTAFLVLTRNNSKSSGSRIKIHGKELDPIAGIFPMDPTSVKASIGDTGHPVSWKQRIENPANSTGGSRTKKHTKTFPSSDIVYATMDKKSGFVFGTPYILPVLDDVRALRRLEEITEIIGQKHAFPFTHWKVGEKDDPPMDYDDGTTEIDIVKNEITNMPTEGGVVTSYRVDSEVLGMAGQAINLDPYLQYFERRVLGGLRLSPEDLGRSEGSKASAVTVSQSLQDSSKDFQAVISDILSTTIVFQLLMEGGFDVTHENMVRITFPMINREEQRARENHGADLFNTGLITRTEMRKEFLNRKELTEEECKECLNEIKHQQAKELANMAHTAQAQRSASSRGENSIANKNRPTNQSGTKPTKTRVKANDIAEELYLKEIGDNFKDTKLALREYMERHGSGAESLDSDNLDQTTKQDELELILSSFITLSMVEARKQLSPIVKGGIKTCMKDMVIDSDYILPKRVQDRFFKNNIEKSFKQICKEMAKDIFNNPVISGVSTESKPITAMLAICDLYEERLLAKAKKHIGLSYRFGYMRTAKMHNYNTVIMKPVQENSDQQSIEVSLKMTDVPYSALLATPGDYEYSISLGNKSLGTE